MDPRCVGLLLFALGVGCSTPSSRLAPLRDARSIARVASFGAATARPRNVVLVTIDGVRWQEIFYGVETARARAAGMATTDETGLVAGPALVPHLTQLMTSGIALGDARVDHDGATMLASGPNFVSLPGYRELLTGRASDRCTNNECAPIAEPTLFDELRAQFPEDELASIASWEKLERAVAQDQNGVTVSAGRHAGATREQVLVSPRAAAIVDEAARARAYPGFGDYRPDRYTTALALEYLRQKRPRFLHVALGDTDEYAHRGDYPGYLGALQASDSFVGALQRELQTMGAYGEETIVVVTTDHGRSRSFVDHGGGDVESARVWLVAAGPGIAARGAIATQRPVHLADIAPTIRSWIALPPDAATNAGAAIAELAPSSPTYDSGAVRVAFRR